MKSRHTDHIGRLPITIFFNKLSGYFLPYAECWGVSYSRVPALN